MARTRGAEADPIEPVEEEIALGPEDEEIVDDDAQGQDDDAGGDGSDADEQEGEGEEAEDEITAEPAPRRGGGSEAVRSVRRRAQEAERELAARNAEIAELRAGQRAIEARLASDPQAAARAREEQRQRRELMTPAEIAADVEQSLATQFLQVRQADQLALHDRLDKQSYDAAARTSRVHRDYSAQVEKLVREERAAGRNPDREVVLKYLVGNDVLERANRAAPAQRGAAARRVAAQRTQPTGARGDAARAGRRPAQGSLEADLALVNAGIAAGHNVFE